MAMAVMDIRVVGMTMQCLLMYVSVAMGLFTMTVFMMLIVSMSMLMLQRFVPVLMSMLFAQM